MFLLTSIPLYLFALLLNNYYFIIDGTLLGSFAIKFLRIICSPRNGLFVGYYFVGIGILIAVFLDELKEKDVKIGLSVCYVLHIAEVFLLREKKAIDDQSLYISFLFLIPFLFTFSAQNSIPVKNCRLLRHLSTSVYLIHCPIITSIEIISYSLHVSTEPFFMTIIVFIIMALFLIPIYTTKKEPLYSLLI